MPRNNPTVQDIVVAHLRENGFDGLWNCDGECACDLADLAPCGRMEEGCHAGYQARKQLADNKEH